jgi:hypothetical protein
MTNSSITTPTTTKKLNAHTKYSHETDEFSRVLSALSSAEMELSKAEASVGELEEVWSKAAKFTIVGLLIAMVYGVSIIILALREEYVYKKAIKRQNND